MLDSSLDMPVWSCRVNHAMSLGLKVGLGTDVAGGYSPSMLNAIRMAVVNGRCLRAQKLAQKVGSLVHSFLVIVVVIIVVIIIIKT